jgi:hypothetical protein
MVRPEAHGITCAAILCMAAAYTSAPFARCQAQRSADVVLRVRVTDVSRSPLADVDLALIKNDTEAVMLGRTNPAGRFAFPFRPESAGYTLAARKVGYVQMVWPLARALKDTVAVDLSLVRATSVQDTIRAIQERLPLAKQPYLGADEIARDTRGIYSLGEVLKKLRPDINYQGVPCVTKPKGTGPAQATRLGGNGRPIGPVRSADPATPAALRIYVNGMWIPDDFHPLIEIHAEHIAELRYVPCLVDAVPGLPPTSWPSIYIVLKPGAGWDLKHGSHIVDSAAFFSAEHERERGSPPTR